MARIPGFATPKALGPLARSIGAPAAVLGLLLSVTPARGQGVPVTFSVVGDYPYSSGEVPLFQQHMDEHDLYSPSDFLVHVGDINAASEGCAASRYVAVANMLKTLSVPAFIIPGDNEWTDCSSPAQGWQWWEDNFSDFEQNFCLPFEVERQAVRRENWAFVHRGVLFCGVNIPDGDAGDATQRLQDDGAWVVFQLQDKGAQVRACVVFGHAGPSAQRDIFFNPFVAQAANFGKPVLYAMGNEHNWLYDNPWSEPNMRRLIVERGGEEPPVEITVGMSSTDPWSIVRNPWAGNPPLYNHPPCVSAGPDIAASSGPVALSGVASDDGPPSSPGNLAVTWSKLSGPGSVSFGNANAATTTATFSSSGTYGLRLTASDGAKSASDDVLVTIGSGGTSYALTVGTLGTGTVALTPSGGTYPAGTVVTLDAQPAAGWAFQGWTGALSGSQDPATITMNGNRDVTATFVAGGGPLVVLGSEHDAHVNSDRPARNYGNETTVRIRSGSPEYRSYFKFDATGLAPVVRATLRLFATDGTNDGGSVHTTSGNYSATSTPWNEQGIVWTNAPSPGSVVAGLGPVATAQWIELDVTAGVAGNGEVSFVVVPTSTNSAYFSSHEGTNPPELVVETATGPPPDDPDVTVTPLSHDFGNLVRGTSASRTVQVRNDGVADLTVAPPALAGPDVTWFFVGVGSAGAVLSPGGTLNVEIGFAPGTLGPKTATLTIASDDPDEPAVAVGLSGSGQEIPAPTGKVAFEEVVSGGGVGGTVVTGAIGGGAAQLYLAALTSKPHDVATAVTGLGLPWTRVRSQCGGRSQTGLDVWMAFGDATGGPVTATLGSSSQSAHIAVTRYSGAKAGAPLGAVVSGNTNGAAGACSGGTDGSAYALNLGAGGAGSFVWSAAALRNRGHTAGAGYTEIAEGASGSGGDAAGLAVQHREVLAPGTVVVDGSLGGAVDWAVVALEIVAAPAGDFADVAVAPASADFGDVLVGTVSAPRTLTVSNVGTADLDVTSVTLGGANAGDFTIVLGQAPFTLGPGQAATIDVACAPQSPGAKSAALTIGSSDPDESSLAVPLSGNGVDTIAPNIAVSPSAHDFGNVVTGTTAISSFVVANVGNAPLSVAAATLLGADAAEFAFVAAPGSFTLAPGETRAVGVSFAPVATGPKAAFLRVASDDPDTPEVDVPLSGNGVDPPVGGGQVVYEESATGSALNALAVSTAGTVAAVPGDLYLAAVSTKPYVSPTGVGGMGLTWTWVASQCAGRNQTGVDVWMAQGVPGAGPVTASFAVPASSGALVVVRYSGVDATTPVGTAVAANTNGPAGQCSGGVDGSSYSVPLDVTADGAVAFVAVAMRNRTHAPGAGYAERAVSVAGSGGSAAAVALADRDVAMAATVAVEGTFNGTVDWAVVGLELRPGAPLARAAAGRPETLASERDPADTDARVVEPGPSEFAFDAVRPNPFRLDTIIEYSLPEPAYVEIVIHDVTGRVVRHLVNARESAGRRSVRWSGRNDAGASVSSGIYFLRWQAGDRVETRKLVLTR